jgi:hypothetical protein
VVPYETTDLEWSSVDKDGAGTEVNYQLQVATEDTFANVIIDEPALTGNTYQTSGVLTGDMTYYWRVRPYDEAANSPGFTAPGVFQTERDYVCGDADGDGIVNVSDAVHEITYIFGGGPPPDPLASGDVNCDETVNISDAVYLIAYIFGGGPEPCAACP